MSSCNDFGCTRSPRRTRRIVCRLKPVSLCKASRDIFCKRSRKVSFPVPEFSSYRLNDGNSDDILSLSSSGLHQAGILLDLKIRALPKLLRRQTALLEPLQRCSRGFGLALSEDKVSSFIDSCGSFDNRPNVCDSSKAANA